MASLAFFLGLGFESYNQLTIHYTGEPAFTLKSMVENAVARPLRRGALDHLDAADADHPDRLSRGVAVNRRSADAAGRTTTRFAVLSLTRLGLRSP